MVIPIFILEPTCSSSTFSEHREHEIKGEYFDEEHQKCRYSCKCGTTFSMMSTLKRHIVEMEKKEVLECEGCGKNFLHKRTLLKHKK